MNLTTIRITGLAVILAAAACGIPPHEAARRSSGGLAAGQREPVTPSRAADAPRESAFEEAHAMNVLPTTAGQTPPTYAQIRPVLTAFMGASSPYGTVGAPGEELYGGEGLARLGPSPLGAGDSGGAWHDANTVEMLADYQLATIAARSTPQSPGVGDYTYQSVIEAYVNNGYDLMNPYPSYGCGVNGGVNLNDCGNGNAYNDDDLWWALAYLRAADLEQAIKNFPMAQSFDSGAAAVFQHVCGQWDVAPACGGGVPQTLGYVDGYPYLNAITNELFFETAMKLYQRDPTATDVCPGQAPWTDMTTAPTAAGGPGGMTHQFQNTYLGWALAEYEWFKERWWLHGSIPMQDGLDNATSCTVSGAVYSYNQGPILGALLDLSNAPRSALASQGEADTASTILAYGFQIASAAMAPASSGGLSKGSAPGVLTETSETDAACVSGNGDCPLFKGIFMRYLARFTNGAAAPWGPYASFTANATSFIDYNAAQIYTNRIAQYEWVPADWSAGGFTDNGMPAWVYQTTETAGLEGLIAGLGLEGPAAPPTPSLPACTYASSTTGTDGVSHGAVTVACEPNSENVPIEIYEWADNQWSPVLAYGASTTIPQSLGTAETYRACVWPQSAGICDTPTTVSFAPFTLTPSLSTITIGAGGSSGFEVDVAGPFGLQVTLSAAGLPANVTASFTPARITPGNATLEPSGSTFFLTVGSTVPAQQVTLTLTGNDGTASYSFPITLHIVTCPSGDVWSADGQACVPAPPTSPPVKPPPVKPPCGGAGQPKCL